MIRILATAMTLTSLAVGTARAEPIYRPKGFMKTGHSDSVAGVGAWKVKGSSREHGGATAIALYRAAELAAAAGAASFRVTKQKVKGTFTTDRRRSFHAYSETASLTVRAVRSAADGATCEMPVADQCMTLPVAGVLARYGPEMGMPAARPGESRAAPVQIVTRGLFGDRTPLPMQPYTTPADEYPAWRRPVVPVRTVTAPPVPVVKPAVRALPVEARVPAQGWTISD